MTTAADPPRVSVLVPAYQGERLLPQALDSVLAQSFAGWEAIVVDDGSTDGTHAAALAYASRDPRIRVMRQDNAGTQAARDAALRAARGEWIALLDQDDLWIATKIEAQLDLVRRHPGANLVFSNYWNWDGTRDLGARYPKGRRLPEGDVSLGLARSCLFQASTVMIPRALALDIGGFDPAFHLVGDWQLWLRLAERGIDARGAAEPLMRYRLWSGNESRRTVAMGDEIVRMLEQALGRRPGAAMRRALRRSLGRERGNVELVRAALEIDVRPELARRALWRAWRHDPARLKLLLRWGCLAWPDALGGRLLAGPILAKIRDRYSPPGH